MLAVAGGVGLSAALGMLRIRWGFGLKYPAIALVAATLLLSGLVAALSERADVCPPPLPRPSRTNWTRLVPPPH